MSKKMNDSTSKYNMNSEFDTEDLLNFKFKERLNISNDLHKRIIDSSAAKKQTTNLSWFAAAGLAILICLNVFSIRNYNKQVRNERLKEFYTNNWNNSTIF
jgi:hypothetical protein